MPLYGAKRETLRDFEEALKAHEELIDKMDRAHIDMNFLKRDKYYIDLKQSATTLLDRGWKVSDLMEGAVVEDAINRFIALLAYMTYIADKPTLGKEERLLRLLEVKNIYVMAKPIIITKHSRE